MTDETSGWFAYSPVDPSSWDELTDEQRAAVTRHRQRAGQEPVCEVRILFASLAPAQAEVRVGAAPPDASTGDVLRAAIRELESALAVFAD